MNATASRNDTSILVTGASGRLGRSLLRRLRDQGHDVRALSRRPHVAEEGSGVLWLQGDLATGEGIARAVEGVEVIIHAATSPVLRTRRVDVLGTERLLREAGRAAVKHVIYPSIVGIDDAPFSYYRIKLAAERAVHEGGVPFTVLRATKFHGFIDGLLRAASRLPVMLLPADFTDQPVDVDEVAASLVEAVERGPVGMAEPVVGPEVLDYRRLASAWLAAQGLRRPIVNVPLPGAAAATFRRGVTTDPAAATRGVTWDRWLERRYGLPGPEGVPTAS